MAENTLPREQSIPVQFLKTGLLSGLDGALNPNVKNEAMQLIAMYRQMDEDHRERVLAQARGGRVLKQAIMQVFADWQRRQSPSPRASAGPLRDTTESDVA